METTNSSDRHATEHNDKLSSSTALGAILPNGKINFKLIEREIVNDISNDARYHAQDAMKKRAIHMSKDYDEFRNYVAVSQLKPIKSTEMGQLFHNGHSVSSEKTAIRNVMLNRIQPHEKATRLDEWDKLLLQKDRIKNGSADGGGGGGGSIRSSKGERHDKSMAIRVEKEDEPSKTDTAMGIPKNSLELNREWKRCRADKSPMQALKYLLLSKTCHVGDLVHAAVDNLMQVKILEESDSTVQLQTLFVIPQELRLSPECIANYYKVELDSSMMEQLIGAIHLLCSSTAPSSLLVTEQDIESYASTLNFIYRYMNSMTQCGRFSLNVSFLNENYRGYVNYIIQRLFEFSSSDKVKDCLQYNIHDIDALAERFEIRSSRIGSHVYQTSSS